MWALLGGVKVAALLLQAQPNSGDLTPDQITQIALAGTKHAAVTEVLVPLAFFAVVALAFWLVMRQKQARLKARDEFYRHLLDKFSTGHEFGEFLQSEAGRQFLAGLHSERKVPKDAMRSGIVLTVVGLGFLGLTVTRHEFAVPGVILLCFGIGLLLSAVISRRLSSKWEMEQKAGSQAGLPS